MSLKHKPKVSALISKHNRSPFSVEEVKHNQLEFGIVIQNLRERPFVNIVQIVRL